jgi:fused signal recognition particle receptor
VLKEKTQNDIDRLRSGMSKTSQKLGVVDELLTLWNLEDAEASLEELEEALIMSDFGPKTSFKIVDKIRPEVEAGRLKSGAEIKAALKGAIVELLTSRGGAAELKLTAR